MPQPANKNELLQQFINFKAKMHLQIAAMQKVDKKGKTKHPGFNYFNANEFLQFAEMHLRHQIKQKERIEEYLAND